MKFDVHIAGDKQIEERFRTAESRLRVYVRETLDLYGAQILSRALSLVPRRTGKLAASIRAKGWQNDTSIREYVKARRFTARFVEGGVADKEIQVSGYTRRTASGTFKGKLPTRSGKLRSRVTAQGVTFVQGYRRRAHQEAQPFMEPAFAPFKDSLEADLLTAVKRAMEKGS